MAEVNYFNEESKEKLREPEREPEIEVIEMADIQEENKGNADP